MKRRERPRQLRMWFPPGSFFQDEYELIAEFASRRGASVGLADEFCQFDSLDDVRQHRGSVAKGMSIHVRFADGYDSLTIEFTRGGIHLRCDPTDRLLPLWFNIGNVLSGLVPWYLRWAYLPWVQHIGVVLFCVALWQRDRLGELLGSGTLAGGALLLLGVCLAGTTIAGFRQPTLRVHRRHESGGFMDRNGEKVVLTLVASVGGAIAKAVFDRFFS